MWATTKRCFMEAQHSLKDMLLFLSKMNQIFWLNVKSMVCVLINIFPESYKPEMQRVKERELWLEIISFEFHC